MDIEHLTDVERQLVHAAVVGEMLDLAPEGADARPNHGPKPRLNARNRIRAEVIRDLLRGKYSDELDPKGVRIRGALIDELVDLDHMSCDWPLELAFSELRAGISANSAELPSLTLINNHIHSQWNTSAAINLAGAHIKGRLDLSGNVLTGRTAPLLMGEGMVVGGSARMDRLEAKGDGERGLILLLNSKIGGALYINDAKLDNRSGPAFSADRITVAGSTFLRRTTLKGESDIGAVRLPGARLGGQLVIRRSTLINSLGPALNAFRMDVSSSVIIDDRFYAEGSGDRGAVRLLGARIGGKLSLEGARLINPNGPALVADGLAVLEDVSLDRSRLNGSGSHGVIRFRLARFGGLLSLSTATVWSDDGPALVANGMKVASNARLDASFWGEATPENGVVQLRGVSIGGRIILARKQIIRACRGGAWEVNDLTFSNYYITDSGKQPETHLWLTFLKDGTVDYAPFVYQQLATISRSLGHEKMVRKFLIGQRRDRLRWGNIGTIELTWEWVLYLCIGFGYQHWRTLIGLLLAMVMSLAVSFGLFGGELVYVADSAAAGDRCGGFDILGYSIGLVLPFIDMASYGACEPRPGSVSDVMRIGGIAVQVLAWGFSLLFIAGFTRAIRHY